MRRQSLVTMFLLLWLAGMPFGATSAGAGGATRLQEGHPLTGTWTGDWGPDRTNRTRVTIVMSWDGKTVSGIMNPGPDAAPLTRVEADWSNWTVRIESTGKDTAGKPAPVVADGSIEDIGSPHRKIVGTWTQGGNRGDFTLTRE